ncbi:MAG: hypothetical protein WC797_03710 [Candidatus Paceibacterota bacterium]|jgi:hypothetical protein
MPTRKEDLIKQRETEIERQKAEAERERQEAKDRITLFISSYIEEYVRRTFTSTRPVKKDAFLSSSTLDAIALFSDTPKDLVIETIVSFFSAPEQGFEVTVRDGSVFIM